MPSNISNSPVQISTPGTSFIRYWSVDNAGNVEILKSGKIMIATPPTTAANATNSDGSAYVNSTWTKQTVNIALSCSNQTGPGCDKTLYCTDSSTCIPNLAYSVPISVTTDGTTYVRFMSNNTLGLMEAVSVLTVMRDSATPTDGSISTSPSTASSVQAVRISATVSDVLSGISSVVLNGFPMIAGAGEYYLDINGSSLGCMASGSCNFSITSSDNAGNSIVVPSSYTIDNGLATLVIDATVVNSNGGTKIPSDLTFLIDGVSAITGAYPVDSFVVHNLTKAAIFGYSASAWSGDCTSDGTVTLAPNSTGTCSITYDDISPMLSIRKHVINDNGGTKVASDFNVSVTGTNATPALFAGMESAINVTLDAGAFTVDENPDTGYAKTLSSGCSGIISVGEVKVCTITNDDIAPTITLIKNVLNLNGGTAVPSDFTMAINGMLVAQNTTVSVTAGVPLFINEIGLPGYSFKNITGDAACPTSLGGNVTLDVGQNMICTITNMDNPGSLTIIKNTIGGDGNFDFVLNGTSGNISVSTASGFGSISVPISAGAYNLEEFSQPGWDLTASNCTASFVVSLNGSVACEVTNTRHSYINVSKVTVPSDNTTQFEINATGTGTVVSGSANITGSHSYTFEVTEGTYNITEVANVEWTVLNNTCVNLGVLPGQTVDCIITNAKKPTLTINTALVPSGDSGLFDVLIDGTAYAFGVNDSSMTQILTIGAHTIRQIGNNTDASFYVSEFSGDCLQNGTIDLAAGDNKICNITNTKGGVLTVAVQVTGGSANPSSFTVNVFSDENSTVSFPGSLGTNITLKPGNYTVSVSSLTGYSTPTMSANCTGNISEGDNMSCLITSSVLPTPAPSGGISGSSSGGSSGISSSSGVLIPSNNTSTSTNTTDDNVTHIPATNQTTTSQLPESNATSGPTAFALLVSNINYLAIAATAMVAVAGIFWKRMKILKMIKKK